MSEKSVLIIFAKAPVPGYVKTRLVPGVSPNKAASIYKRLLSRTLNLANQTDFSSIQVWVDGDIQHEFFKNMKKRYGYKLSHQTGRDLGVRMSNAFRAVLRNYSQALLIGGDCVNLRLSDLRQARSYLEYGHDVVLGPAADGGYYLIGLRENNPRLFQNIKWGNEIVTKQTLSRINAQNLKLALLPQRNDLDESKDLLAYFQVRDSFYI